MVMAIMVMMVAVRGALADDCLVDHFYSASAWWARSSINDDRSGGRWGRLGRWWYDDGLRWWRSDDDLFPALFNNVTGRGPGWDSNFNLFCVLG